METERKDAATGVKTHAAPAEHSPRAGVDPSNNDSDRKCIVTVSYSLIPVLMQVHITMSLHSSSMNTVIHNSSKLMAHAKGHGMF